MNRKQKKIEKKIRVSEAVQQTCSNHISEWEVGRIGIINKFISYLEKMEIENESPIQNRIAKLEVDKQIKTILEEFIRQLDKDNLIDINKKKGYEFITDNEKKTEMISISMTIQQHKEIERAARRYNKEVNQFIRQPFYFFERHKKFPWE